MSFLFPSSTITLEAALRDLAQGSGKARAAAAQALGDISDPAARRRAVEALIAALDDDLPEVRAEACGSLGSLGDASAIPKIVKKLDDGTPIVRQHAAIALGSIGDPAGFAPLATALKEGPADLRFQAVSSIAEIDEERAYEPILAALDDRDPQVVGAAALALGALADVSASPALLKKLDHADPVTRFDVAYALADLGNDRGRPLLITAIMDPDRSWDAITALSLLGGPDDMMALAFAIGDKKTPPEATVLAAGKLCELVPESEHAAIARRVLIMALGARKVHVRSLAVEQLGLAGTADWAVPPLEKLLKSSKGAELADAIGLALRQLEARERGESLDEGDDDDDE
ncbi:MAG: HEAT repeat domain-containing protein [Proteobacteria bacterium]|nr:HEAT repeat domain-containing protein [Pseudomonadota bacterium]